MTALERIAQLKEEMAGAIPNTPVPKRWQIVNPGALPMTIKEDFDFLLRAFGVTKGFLNTAFPNMFWEDAFEEAMKEETKDSSPSGL